MEEQVQKLLDRQALEELVNRYCHAVDRKEFAQLEHLYHSDAWHDHGDLFQGKRDDFIQWLRERMPALTTHHFVGNCLFAIDNDRAEGEVYTINYHIIPGEEGPRDYIAGGRYLDRYIREDGRWWIQHRKRVVDWSHERPTSASALAAGLNHSSQTFLKSAYPLLAELLGGD